MGEWIELCKKSQELYVSRDQQYDPSKPEIITPYTQKVMDESHNFVKSIIKPSMRVLDLGGSDIPWFSYLAADIGAKCTVYDVLNPLHPKMLKEKSIEYIQGDVSELHNLGKFDLIFCRNLMPAQQLIDWYDLDFLRMWDLLLQMTNRIYWIQMSGGSGVPSTDELAFANHTRQYFQDFFKRLGVKAIIRKYGYVSFEIGKVLPEPSGEKQELQGLDLIKWVAYQMQNAGSTVKAPRELHRILKVLYEDNFRLSEFKIKNGHDIKNVGYPHDSYFLVDEHEDRRFSKDFWEIVNRN